MLMSDIFKKIYHIRKYDNIEYEAKKKAAAHNGAGKQTLQFYPEIQRDD